MATATQRQELIPHEEPAPEPELIPLAPRARDQVVACLMKFAELNTPNGPLARGKRSPELWAEDLINGYDLHEAFVRIRGILPPDEQQIVENFDRTFQEHAQGALDALRTPAPREVIPFDPHWRQLCVRAQDCLRRLGEHSFMIAQKSAGQTHS